MVRDQGDTLLCPETSFSFTGAIGGTWTLWGIRMDGGAGLQGAASDGVVPAPCTLNPGWACTHSVMRRERWRGASPPRKILEALQLLPAPTVGEASRRAATTLGQARGEELRSPAKAN